jgi:hypothetical protein
MWTHGWLTPGVVRPRDSPVFLPARWGPLYLGRSDRRALSACHLNRWPGARRGGVAASPRAAPDLTCRRNSVIPIPRWVISRSIQLDQGRRPTEGDKRRGPRTTARALTPSPPADQTHIHLLHNILLSISSLPWHIVRTNQGRVLVLRAMTRGRTPIGVLSPLDLEDEDERGGLAWFPRRRGR